MSSQVFICNLALANIAKPPISSISEGSVESTACLQFYDHTRKMLIESHPWSFAKYFQSMAENGTNLKADEWGYSYAKPAACLTLTEVRAGHGEATPNGVWMLEGGDYGLPYERENEIIYCDISPALAMYIRDVTDATKFSSGFIEAFAWHLAARLAMPLTRDPQVRSEAMKVAYQTEQTAKAHDANQDLNVYNFDSEFIVGRL